MGVESEIGRIEEGKKKKFISDLENIDGSNSEIEIYFESDGFSKAVAFFDIDGTLARFKRFHGEAVKALFPNVEDKEELAKVFLDGIALGTTYRVHHRMIGIYKQGKEEWKELAKYLEWLFSDPQNQKDVDEEGILHEQAKENSYKHSIISAQLAEKAFSENPDEFENTKIKPVFHLANIYKRMGIPMVVMTANDEPFARSISKLLGFSDLFLAMACQKDFPNQGKKVAIEYLIKKLEEKGISVPKGPKPLIIVGDSLDGDIASGAEFAKNHQDYRIEGVLVSKNEIETEKDKIKNKPELNDIRVEILNPDYVEIDENGMPKLARYRKKYITKTQ